ncbi:MAG: HAMP domain-containing sensor histidine kinase [Patescibacteria group bacterium]
MTVFLAVFSFGLGSWIYFERRDDPRNITLASLLLAAALWVFSLALMRVSTEPWQASFWFRTMFVIASLLPTLFFLFVRVFPRGSLPSAAAQGALFLPSIVLSWFAFFSPLLTNPDSAVLLPLGRMIFGLHFGIMLAVAAVALAGKFRDRKVAVREQARTILAAAVSFAPLAWALYLVPIEDAGRWYLLAAFAVETGMLVAVTTVIRRRLIVDARSIGAEAFFSLAFSTFVVDLVISETTLAFSIRLAILLLLALYGGMTVKNLVSEVRRREEIQALNDQLVKVNGHLLALDKMKTTFVSMASHQLRAPLSGIRGYLELLKDGSYGPVTDQQRDILGANLDATGRLLETIENFLDVAKIDLGRLEIMKTPTSLQELAAKAAREVGVLATKKGLVLNIDIPSSVPTVKSDASKLYHVLINLLDNAIKYTEHGHVDLTCRREKDSVVVSVTDTGIGLTPAERKNLFQLFSRGRHEVREQIVGSGMGLYILKSIVDAHGGQVFVESAGKGRGSTFGFRIPIK